MTKRRGKVQLPSYIVKSLPQRPTPWIWISASSGPHSGMGTSMTSSWRGPVSTAAFIKSRSHRHAPEVDGLEIREVLNHPTRALSPDPGVLDATERHMIETLIGRPVHDQAAHIEVANRLKHASHVVGEQTALQPIPRRVRLADRLREVIERQD